MSILGNQFYQYGYLIKYHVILLLILLINLPRQLQYMIIREIGQLKKMATSFYILVSHKSIKYIVLHSTEFVW